MKITFARICCFSILAILVSLPSPAVAVKRRAFATSIRGDGNLALWPGAGGATGLTAGDNICRARAAAAGLPNAATYRAFLTDETTDAYCHVQGLSGKKSTGCNGAPQPGGGPWYLSNGITTYTASLAEATSAEPKVYRSVVVDELGSGFPGGESEYWTGSRADGTTAFNHCSNWGSANSVLYGGHGDAHQSYLSTFDGNLLHCDLELSLLCLEPGASEADPVGWGPGAMAFVTSTFDTGDLSQWEGAAGFSGVAAGDAICRAHAAAAHLPAPESFVSWLSDATRDAKDAITADAIFRRVDGYPIAFSRGDLIDGVAINSLHLDELGRYIGDDNGVFTGSSALGVGTAYDCDSWGIGDGSALGTVGRESFSRTELWSEAYPSSCASARRLYCFSNAVTIFWDGFELTGDTTRWSSVEP